MRKICGIYKIINNINGMEYCGQSKDCWDRWVRHKRPSSNVAPIDQAINKFGVDNFSFQILLECPTDMLDVWERDMINLYDTLYPNGYNMRGGGKQEYTDICEESRIKMSEGTKGNKRRPLTEEHRRKISQSNKGKSHGKGIPKPPFTEEHRKNLSKSKMGDKNPMYGKIKTKSRWLTPSGEIREMHVSNATQWHHDWTLLEE